jgi:hypothetical protein
MVLADGRDSAEELDRGEALDPEPLSGKHTIVNRELFGPPRVDEVAERAANLKRDINGFVKALLPLHQFESLKSTVVAIQHTLMIDSRGQE